MCALRLPKGKIHSDCFLTVCRRSSEASRPRATRQLARPLRRGRESLQRYGGRSPSGNQASQQAANGNGKHTLRVRPDTWDGKAAVLLDALLAVKKGDGSAKLPVTWPGISGKIAQAFNDVVELNVRTQTELARLSRVVGKEGKLKQRANLGDVSGFWRENVEAVNSLMEDLVHPSSEVARVIGAVAQGDLSKSMALEVEGRPLEGEFLRTAKTINTMVEQLGTFAVEVTRVAREVGSEDGELRPASRGAGRRRHLEGPDPLIPQFTNHLVTTNFWEKHLRPSPLPFHFCSFADS